jgi:hypothetical protein
MPSNTKTLCLGLVGASALAVLSGCGSPEGGLAPYAKGSRSEVTAIYSSVGPGDARPEDARGVAKTESYELVFGGSLDGPLRGETIEGVGFDEMLRVLPESLGARNYRQSEDPGTTRLLIKVYWGSTRTPDDDRPPESRQSGELLSRAASATSGQERDALNWQAQMMLKIEANQDLQTDQRNADLLGYSGDIDRADSDPARLAALKAEVRERRLYVVLMAYDCQSARHLGRERLLWETRFSIPRQGNDFERALPLMAFSASDFFGRDSGGIVHRILGEGGDRARP